jgi:4a-hydroxytetrahydrobiopterin dehydratase
LPRVEDVGAVCDAAWMSDRLSRAEASAAVGRIGWRYLLGSVVTSVAVSTLADAAKVVGTVVDSCAAAADEHLRVDVRPGRVELTLQDRAEARVTGRDVELAHGITDAVRDLGLDTSARPPGGRPVQLLELAIDALDIAAVRPFWKAVLAYVDEPGYDGPEDPLIDPVRQLPALWFQQMDAPRPQRNRIHFDLTVPHDEAEARVAAALANGGTLVSDDRARAFWVLADAEGNEVCVCTWQDRDA